MKKIFSSLILSSCLVIATIGIGGCSGCSFENNSENGGQIEMEKNTTENNSENGGQTEVEKITTLEGTWKSEEGRVGEYSIICITDSTIRVYINQGVEYKDELSWAGIYIPFTEPVSEGEWTFENDNSCEEAREDNDSRTFTYSNEQLSCYMRDPHGHLQTIYFTKVSD